VPRDVVALVSADDFVSAVRVYSDRVNDLLRRNGVPALEAIEVSETHALALLDAVVNAPETVIDLAGWWFARAIEMTALNGRDGSGEAAEEPISMLAGTSGEEQVRTALDRLPDAERAAVMLRDGYDLPSLAVGVALRRGGDTAADLIATGRLRLVAAYDARPVPDLAGHNGRTTVDLVSLSALADGTLEAPRAAPLRRHASNCQACEEVLESLAKGRRLAAGLPIIAMDDDARESMIERIASRAHAVLPTHEAVLRAVDEDYDPGPAISPILIFGALLLALSLGIAIAVISRADSSPAATPLPTTSFVPTDSPFPLAPAPHRSRHPRTTSAQPSETPREKPSKTPRDTPTPTPKPSKSSSPPVTARARITLSPSRGPSGTTITVTGSGFPPGTRVQLRYAATDSVATARVDGAGQFVGQLSASALLPGAKTVTARDGSTAASARFTQTF
jgi:hypothetical protein